MNVDRPLSARDRRVVDTTALVSLSHDVPDNPLLDYTFSLGFSNTTNDQPDASPGFPSSQFCFKAAAAATRP